MFGTFQSIMLLYVNILCSGMVIITLWYVHVPFIASNVAIYFYERTNVPVFTARFPTFYQQPFPAKLNIKEKAQQRKWICNNFCFDFILYVNYKSQEPG